MKERVVFLQGPGMEPSDAGQGPGGDAAAQESAARDQPLSLGARCKPQPCGLARMASRGSARRHGNGGQ